MTNTDKTRGRFLAIDGPNGVGKSEVAAHVAISLRGLGKPVLQTKEPTARFALSNEERVHGIELARLIVEDRRLHLALDVEPALRCGEWVVCDRYVCSSLVFRALDEVRFEETWAANKDFRTPDLSVVLTADPDTIGMRLQERKKLSRFERQHSPHEEINLYREAQAFLRCERYNIREVLNEHRSAVETANEIATLMLAV